MDLTRVMPVDIYVIPEEEQANPDANSISEDNPVQVEKLEMLIRAEKRLHEFKEIIYNQQTQKIPYYVFFYGIGGVLLGILTNLITALVPVRDAIENPAYLLDFIPTRLCGLIMSTANSLLLFRYWTNTRCMDTVKHYGLSLLLSIVIVICIVAIIPTVIWTRILGYQLPIPFQQVILGPTIVITNSMAIWCLIPVEWRKSDNFRKRHNFFVANMFFQSLMYYEYVAMGLVFDVVSNEYQWAVSITLPFLREANIWVQEKIAYKSADGKDASVSIAVIHGVNSRHSVFLSVMVGTKATKLSSWIILLADFFYNLYLALRLVWIKKMKPKNEINDREMFHLLFSLTINELVEVVIPLTFSICFLCAFYGPNAELIGGVKSTHFHYKPVVDIHGFIQNMTLFLMVDFCSIVFVALILWIFCKVSLIQAYATMLKELWSIITVSTAFIVWTVIT